MPLVLMIGRQGDKDGDAEEACDLEDGLHGGEGRNGGALRHLVGNTAIFQKADVWCCSVNYRAEA